MCVLPLQQPLPSWLATPLGPRGMSACGAPTGRLSWRRVPSGCYWKLPLPPPRMRPAARSSRRQSQWASCTSALWSVSHPSPPPRPTRAPLKIPLHLHLRLHTERQKGCAAASSMQCSLPQHVMRLPFVAGHSPTQVFSCCIAMPRQIFKWRSTLHVWLRMDM